MTWNIYLHPKSSPSEWHAGFDLFSEEICSAFPWYWNTMQWRCFVIVPLQMYRKPMQLNLYSSAELDEYFIFIKILSGQWPAVCVYLFKMLLICCLQGQTTVKPLQRQSRQTISQNCTNVIVAKALLSLFVAELFAHVHMFPLRALNHLSLS